MPLPGTFKGCVNQALCIKEKAFIMEGTFVIA